MAGSGGDSYDAIVVGAGLGGLSAAALLARAGLKVIAVEAQDGPGGYARGFERGGYRFDPAIHVVPERELIGGVLEYLGVRERCEFLPLPHLYGASFPGLRFVAPVGSPEIFVEEYVRLFPGEADGLRRFWREVGQFFQDLTTMAMRIGLRDLDEAARQLPTLFKYRTAVLGAVLDEYLTEPRVKSACSAIWPYWGLPPSRLSFQTFSQTAGIMRGLNHCRGGTQSLVDALAAGLAGSGGTLLLGTPVDRIRVEGGKAAGVRLASGRDLRAPVVISNADARHSLEELVGAGQLPEPYVRRLRHMEPSVSACVLFTATRLDVSRMGAVHEEFLHGHWDHEESYRDALQGKPGGMWVTVPTLIDPSLAPPGEHTVTLTALSRYDVGSPWEERKERQTESMLDVLAARFPGFREHLAHVELATPESLRRHGRNHQGAIYGWAMTPSQVASKRLGRATPVEGLYLSGHWTEEGPGSFRAVLSGVRVADVILRKAGRADAMPDFRPAHMPRLGAWKKPTEG
jgi:prolycopene isomerase